MGAPPPVAIVTGAARGLGLAITERLCSEGMTVLMADVLAEELTREATRLLDDGAQVSPVATDLRDTAAIRVLIERAEELGGPDVLVNNAGIQRDGLIEDLSQEDWAAVIEVDLLAAARLSALAFPSMKAKRSGRIVNISSIMALGNYGQSNYAAAKSGLIGLSRSLALEGAKLGVTVNVVCPGAIETPGTAAFRERAPEVFEKFRQSIPMRDLGVPADVANAVAFFTDERAHYITGQVLFVGGGLDVGMSRALV